MQESLPYPVKHRPNVGIMGADERQPIAIVDSPAILLCQHLTAARRAQHAVHHAVRDSVRSTERVRRWRALQPRPAGGLGDQRVGTAIAQRTFAADDPASVTSATCGTRAQAGAGARSTGLVDGEASLLTVPDRSWSGRLPLSQQAFQSHPKRLQPVTRA